MRFNARLDTSHHGPPHSFKDAGAVADSLTGIHSAMKCLDVVNRSCIHKGLQMSPHVNIQRIQVRRAWRPCSILLYLSIRHDMLLRTSRKARLRCAGAHSCILSAVTRKLNVSGHMLIWRLSGLVRGSRAQSSSASFSCTVYNPCFILK
jgi:hypothetical protein